MADCVSISFEERCKLDENMNRIGEPFREINISVDGMSACMGYFSNLKEALDIINPKVIIKNLEEFLSVDELVNIIPILEVSKGYNFYGKFVPVNKFD